MSGRAPKQKGNRIERECVNLAKEYGFKDENVYGNDFKYENNIISSINKNNPLSNNQGKIKIVQKISCIY